MGFWRNLLVGTSLLTLGGTAVAQEERAATPLGNWARPTLTPFTSDAEFRRYLRALNEGAEARLPGAGRRPLRFAQAAGAGTQSDAPPEPVCPPEDPSCGGQDMVAVTGSRVAGRARTGAVSASAIANPSITNVQEMGVDEGDIVKQIGKFLLVLQDGRLFIVDTRPGGRPGMRVTDRVNVYRTSDADTWYDEMLVAGNRVLVTGYSYGEDATELSVFRLNVATGRIVREGIFYMSSNDYYDTENYATRLVGDNLIVYTPLDLSALDASARIRWPVVRRWEAAGRRSDPPRGRPLLDAQDIYRPVRDGPDPALHTISVCPLRGASLQCRTTGFIGPSGREFHVSPTDAYLWTSESTGYRAPAEDCARPGRGGTNRALLFRMPQAAGRRPGVIGVSGTPIDYLSLDTGGDRFRALLRRANSCGVRPDGTTPLSYFETRLDRFGPTLREAPVQGYTPMPGVGVDMIENRFTDAYLVYGGRRYYGSYPPEAPGTEPHLAVAVPLARPGEAQRIQIPHSVLRVEQAGSNVVLTGYRDQSGLDVSLIDLRAAPRVASTAHLEGRYETEGRSHAFNSLIAADGSGPMGVPTTRRISRSGRYWSYSSASDVSFLAADRTGRLTGLGELVSHSNGPNAGKDDDQIDNEGVWDDYACEVSCIDWYGNSRPIFTDGRIFALAGSELIEGRIEGGHIREVRRVNLTIGPIRYP